MTEQTSSVIQSIRQLILQYDASRDRAMDGPLLFSATELLLSEMQDSSSETYRILAYFLADRLNAHAVGMSYDKRTEFAPEMELYFRRALLLASQALSAQDGNLRRFVESVSYYEK